MKRFLKCVILLTLMQIFSLKAFAEERVENIKALEDNIHNHLENRDVKFNIIYTGTRKEFEENIRQCITNSYSNDDYLERSWLEIKPKAQITFKGIETTMEVTYLTTKEQEAYINSELEKITKSLVSTNMSELEKVKIINEYIINRYEYDYTQKSISVYSALTTSFAVCQGYSMTAYKMLNYAGVENKIIVGTLKGAPHSWNSVKIDGNWYQLDITNNDSKERNKYFLVSDEILTSNEYSWDRDKYPKALKGYY
ncbi:transglutaminase domain-containing protein [Clostridium sp. C2-6-12]|uniref:transglutaminase domain-containing protein n=1 Tax=Clostridium sp. C2-6-12 TaxID=2698832 RepID=UPI0013704C34|nr:transglutaminase domain-containing protein [Clostridium sp. C2-6-12]